MSNYVMMVNNNNHLVATCSASIMGQGFMQFTKKFSKVGMLIRKKRWSFRIFVELSLSLPNGYAGKVLYLFLSSPRAVLFEY